MAKSNSNPQLAGFNISFLIRSSYTNKNGESPIVIKLVYYGERKELNTGFSVKVKHWNSSTGFVKNNAATASTINKELVKLQYDVETTFTKMKEQLGDFRIGELIERLKGTKEAPQTIQEYMKLTIDDYESRIGVDLAQTTFYKYRRTTNYFTSFLKQKRGLANLPVSRIDADLLNAFFLYLRKEKKNSHNSSSALMNCLRTILEEPVKKGVIRRNPFHEVELTRKPVHRAYLTLDEIKSLQNLKGLSDALERNCDLFLFACFTGLAYIDIKKLKRIHIIVDPDGSKHIEAYRGKNNELSYIPLIEAAEQILLKYSPTGDCRDFIWRVPSNQKLNKSLKVIAKLAGIEKNLFMHLGRHTFATTVTLSRGISIESVSKMLGHSTLKHTQIYAKIVNSKVKDEMKKLEQLF